MHVFTSSSVIFKHFISFSGFSAMPENFNTILNKSAENEHLYLCSSRTLWFAKPTFMESILA